jgi:hypothetical protein
MSAPQKGGTASGSPKNVDRIPYTLVQQVQIQSNIRVTDHDVLNGRGPLIAQHAGNERFRALVIARHDVNYCHSYTTKEKRAIAEEIVRHIKDLNPPGRFLRRSGRSSRSVRGLDGPWEELSKDEAIKKTCQALRDCNRQDRTGYAASVAIPADVSASKQAMSKLGLTNKQLAELAVAREKQLESPRNRNLATINSPHVASIEPTPFRYEPTPIGDATTNSASLLWYVKHNMTEGHVNSFTPMPLATPTTSGSSSDYSSIRSGSPDGGRAQASLVHHHHTMEVYSPIANTAMKTLLSIPCDSTMELKKEASSQHRVSTSTANEEEFDDCHDEYSTHFDEDYDAYHLTSDSAIAAAMEESRSGDNIGHSRADSHRDDDFGPPSPIHLHEQNDDDPF